MLLRELKKLLAFIKQQEAPRQVPVLQLEVTSRCQMQCTFCPRTVLGKTWQNGDLPWQDYKQYIAPYLKHTGLLYLSGWGEPLLYPYLFHIMQEARAAGCLTGFTTNGMLLSRDSCELIIDSGTSSITISAAGATAAMHDSIRVDSRAPKLFSHIEQLASIRARKNSSTPRIVLFYMMTRENIKELPDFAEIAARLGADELVATNVDYTPAAEVDRMSLINCARNREMGKEKVLQARERALQNRLVFYPYPRQLGTPLPVCEAFADGVTFVNHRGEAAPCVYLGLPVQGNIPRYFCGEKQSPVRHFIINNIREVPLPEIWQSERAREFTGKMEARVAAAGTGGLVITGPVNSPAELPPCPPPCSTCYKLYGV